MMPKQHTDLGDNKKEGDNCHDQKKEKQLASLLQDIVGFGHEDADHADPLASSTESTPDSSGLSTAHPSNHSFVGSDSYRVSPVVDVSENNAVFAPILPEDVRKSSPKPEDDEFKRKMLGPSSSQITFSDSYLTDQEVTSTEGSISGSQLRKSFSSITSEFSRTSMASNSSRTPLSLSPRGVTSRHAEDRGEWRVGSITPGQYDLQIDDEETDSDSEHQQGNGNTPLDLYSSDGSPVTILPPLEEGSENKTTDSDGGFKEREEEDLFTGSDGEGPQGSGNTVLNDFELELESAVDQHAVQEMWERFCIARNIQVQASSVSTLELNLLALKAGQLVRERLTKLLEHVSVDMGPVNSLIQESDDGDQQGSGTSEILSVIKSMGLLREDALQFDVPDFLQKAFQTAIGAGMGYAYWKLSDDKAGSSNLSYLLSPVSALINGALYEIIAERILKALKAMIDECYDDSGRFQCSVFCKYFFLVVPLLLAAAIPSAPMLAASLKAGMGSFSYFPYVMRTIATAQSLPTICEKFRELRSDLQNTGCIEAAATTLAFLCAIIYTLAQHSSVSAAISSMPGLDRYEVIGIMLEVIAILGLFPFNLNWSAEGLKVALGIQKNDAEISDHSTDEGREENEEQQLKNRVSLILLAFLSGLPSVAMVEAGHLTHLEKEFQFPIDVASYVSGSLMNLASIFLNSEEYSGCVSMLMGLVVKLMAIVLGTPVVGAYKGLSYCSSTSVGYVRESIGLSLHTRPDDVGSNGEGIQGDIEEGGQRGCLSFSCFGNERGESNRSMLGERLITPNNGSDEDPHVLMEQGLLPRRSPCSSLSGCF